MKIKISRIIIFSAFILTFVLLVTGNKLFHSYSEPKTEYRYLALFAEVASLVKTNYVEEVNPNVTFPGAYSAMLAALDNQSAYLDQEKTALYYLYMQEKTCASGIYGAKNDGYFAVTDVIANSPAAAACLKAGDYIKAVNGKSIYGLSFWEMALALVSEQPTALELVVLKENALDPVKIKVQTVRHLAVEESQPIIEKIRDDILRVNVQRVNAATCAALKQALTQSATNHPHHLLLDLRKYRGGDLNSFTVLCQLLFPQKVTLHLKLKERTETIVLGSTTNPAYRAVVIINPSTILYGELLAVLFKAANPNVTLVGLKTEGFISQLKHVALPDGSSILLSDGLFHLENQKSLNTGLDPDIVVKNQDFDAIIDRSIAILDARQKQ